MTAARPLTPVLSHVRDTAVTLILWSYFTLGFIVLFSPRYLLAWIFARDRETGS